LSLSKAFFHFHNTIHLSFCPIHSQLMHSYEINHAIIVTSTVGIKPLGDEHTDSWWASDSGKNRVLWVWSTGVWQALVSMLHRSQEGWLLSQWRGAKVWESVLNPGTNTILTCMGTYLEQYLWALLSYPYVNINFCSCVCKGWASERWDGCLEHCIEHKSSVFQSLSEMFWLTR
jgi:hypothetical protein